MRRRLLHDDARKPHEMEMMNMAMMVPMRRNRNLLSELMTDP